MLNNSVLRLVYFLKSHQMNHLAESTGDSNLTISWLQIHQMTKNLFIYFSEWTQICLKSHQMNHLAESTGNSNLAISWLQIHQMTKNPFIYFSEWTHTLY